MNNSYQKYRPTTQLSTPTHFDLYHLIQPARQSTAQNAAQASPPSQRLITDKNDGRLLGALKQQLVNAKDNEDTLDWSFLKGPRRGVKWKSTNPDEGLTIQDAPFDGDSTLLTYTDASWANSARSTDQLGAGDADGQERL